MIFYKILYLNELYIKNKYLKRFQNTFTKYQKTINLE